MSEELTGRDSVEQGLGGREPLPEWNPPTPDEPKTYEGTGAAIDAGNDLTAERGSSEPPLVEITDKRHSRDDRKYYTTVEDAAHDLSEFHKGENAIQAAENLNELAAEVDQLRATWPNGAQQPAQQEQSAQAETPPPIDSPQPEAAEVPSGLDPEVERALSNPKIRAAIEEPIRQAAATQQAYNNAVQQAAEIAGASVLAAYPELNGLNNQERAVALHLMQTQNPQRFSEIQGQLQQVNSIYGEAQRAKYAQAQQAYSQFQEFGKQQDAVFENATRDESPETIRAAGKEVVDFAKEQGISHEALAQLYATNPVLRSAVFQQIMLGFAKHRMASRTATANPASRANVPPVMRPGTSRDASDVAYEDVSRLRDEFRRKSGNDQLRAAVRLQQAQRAARR